MGFTGLDSGAIELVGSIPNTGMVGVYAAGGSGRAAVDAECSIGAISNQTRGPARRFALRTAARSRFRLEQPPAGSTTPEPDRSVLPAGA